ncbi:MAG: hypothetical protein ABMA13_00590 [Chthoniobacteraceae bacterium]
MHPPLLFLGALFLLLLTAPAASAAKAPQILMIGDSLSVGPFGATLQEKLIDRFGGANVSIYASCGSSPEHWLLTEPVFVTRCGYREKTAKTSFVREYENGRRPMATGTPKVERLIGKHGAQIVIVQLGTNWMDDFAPRITEEEVKKKAAILARMGGALRGRKVFWILPPDTTKFSRAVESTVRSLILRAARTYRFGIIDSSDMTHYVVGRTGSDGVHYGGADARSWASQVMVQLARNVPAVSSPRIHINQ